MDYKRHLADKVRGFIVIGSIQGGDKAFYTVIPKYCESEYMPVAILLFPAESDNSKAWLEGNMVESEVERLRLEHFTHMLLKEWMKKGEVVPFT